MFGRIVKSVPYLIEAVFVLHVHLFVVNGELELKLSEALAEVLDLLVAVVEGVEVSKPNFVDVVNAVEHGFIFYCGL